jgi:hypothetical protein
MANTFVADLVPRILPATLQVLREDQPLVGWASKNYSDSAGMLGDTVTIQRSYPMGTAGDVAPAMIAPSPSNIAPGYTQIKIDSWKKANFGLTQKEYAEIIAGNQIPFQVEEAIRSVVNAVATSAWSKFYQISNTAGKSATGCVASNSVSYVAGAAKELDLALCPKGNRRMFLSLKDCADLRTNTAYGQYYYAGPEPVGSNIVRDGQFKSFYDFKSVEADYSVPVMTVTNTLGSGTVALDVAGVAGDQTISVTVTGGTGLILNAGSIITIGSETFPARDKYSVTEAVASATGAGNIIKLNRGLSTAKSIGASVTLAYTSGTDALATSVQNICGDPTGIGIVMRYPASDMMGNRTMGESFPLVDPMTGAVLCLTHLSGYHMSMWEVSALFGTAFVDERKLCRLVSYAALS